MNTLDAEPLAPLLDRLFLEADAATSPALKAMPKAERNRLLKSKTEYLQFYSLVKELWLPVSRETGELLYIMARNAQATSIVEFGTSFGISTLYLAAALHDNGGGRLITTEFEPSKVARARRNLEDAGLADLVDVREGDALQTLAQDLPATIDLLLLDGAKALYGEVLDLLEPRLRPGALIIADDADQNPEYLARVRAADRGYVSLAFGEDVELSLRVD